MEYPMQVIARIHSEFSTKFGVPRQSGLVDALEAEIVFEPSFRNPDALRGLEGFSHLWLLWVFDQAAGKGWSPTVRPPRLGGNARMGVFATGLRSGPNPIALSAVRLAGIEHDTRGPILRIRGADLMDGTPILDIKPYIPYADAHPDARGRLCIGTAGGAAGGGNSASVAGERSAPPAGGAAGRAGPGSPAPVSGGPAESVRLRVCGAGGTLPGRGRTGDCGGDFARHRGMSTKNGEYKKRSRARSALRSGLLGLGTKIRLCAGERGTRCTCPAPLWPAGPPHPGAGPHSGPPRWDRCGWCAASRRAISSRTDRWVVSMKCPLFSKNRESIAQLPLVSNSKIS